MLTGIGTLTICGENKCPLQCVASFQLSATMPLVRQICIDYVAKTTYTQDHIRNSASWVMQVTIEPLSESVLKALLNVNNEVTSTTFPISDGEVITEISDQYSINTFNLESLTAFEFFGEIYQDGDRFAYISVPRMFLQEQLNFDLNNSRVQATFILEKEATGDSLPFRLWEN